MKNGQVSKAEYIPQHRSFRDHAMIRKAFYDEKEPISREQAISEWIENNKKTTEDVVKTLVTDYSTKHVLPCQLETRIRTDMNTALRGGDKYALSILRLVINDIQYAEFDKRDNQLGRIDFRKRLDALKDINVKLSDEEIIRLIQKRIKENDELIVHAEKGNRSDKLERARAENNLLYAYLPKQLSDGEVIRIINGLLTANPQFKQAGPIIGIIMKKYKGQVNGKRVGVLVNKYFSRTQ